MECQPYFWRRIPGEAKEEVSFIDVEAWGRQGQDQPHQSQDQRGKRKEGRTPAQETVAQIIWEVSLHAK